MPAGRRSQLAIVVDPDGSSGGSPRTLVVTAARQLKRLAAADFVAAVEPVGKVRLPKNFNPRSPQSRRDLVSSLRALDLPDDIGRAPKSRSAAADDAEIARLRAAIRRHPCHGCADR